MSARLPGSATILLYHRVAHADRDPFALCVPPDVFRDQMTYIRATCRPVSLDALVQELQSGAPRERTVAVTFDDGYLDNLTAASPVLTELGVPATFFLTTGALHGVREYWWDALARAGFDDETRRGLHEQALGLSRDDRDELLADLLDVGTPAELDARPMIASEIVRLAAQPGHTMGAHTVNHLFLPNQSAPTWQFELRQCKRDLEALLGTPVTTVAYPFGACSPGVVAAAEEAGFAAGVTVASRAVGPESDRFALPRWAVPADRQTFVDTIERLFAGS